MTGTELYVDLMKRSLLNALHPETVLIAGRTPIKRAALSLLRACGVRPAYVKPFDPAARGAGGWPTTAHTLLGMNQLDNLHACVESVLARGVPGDLIETGVWRGGAVILMRAVLKAHGVTERRVWVADSFAGLPRPNETKYPADAGDRHYTLRHTAVSLDEVRANFAAYGLLDDQVVFLKGWFKDTLPRAPFTRLAILRLDGDMYESTMDALRYLYPKLSPGGYCIVDDYTSVAGCRRAVEEYRASRGITGEILAIPGFGAYWQAQGKDGSSSTTSARPRSET